MISRKVLIVTVLVSAVVVAFLLGKNEALRESLHEAQQQPTVVPSSLSESLPVSDATPAAATTSSITGEVIALADGDSFTLLDADQKQHKVRIQGIDAPELGQDFCQESKQQLSALIFGKAVKVSFSKFDKYGRVVGKVTAANQDVGRRMISTGLAWFYRNYANELTATDREVYDNEESAAKANGKGLWSIGEPMPPWEYRHPTPSATPQVATVESVSIPKPTAPPKTTPSCVIIGNTNSRIYHLPGCRSYDRVAPHNREYFCTEEEAMKAGYRKARNC